MIVPAVGGVASELAALASGAGPAAPGASAGLATPSQGAAGVGGLEGGQGVAGPEGLGASQGSGGLGALGGGEGAGAGGGTPSFGNALSEAISSLEASQLSSDAASQALATGTVSNPESAVTTVEDAALEMQLAAQMRTKATEAVQTIFQTQV